MWSIPKVDFKVICFRGRCIVIRQLVPWAVI
jgi:hypothetical protein